MKALKSYETVDIVRFDQVRDKVVNVPRLRTYARIDMIKELRTPYYIPKYHLWGYIEDITEWGENILVNPIDRGQYLLNTAVGVYDN